MKEQKKRNVKIKKMIHTWLVIIFLYAFHLHGLWYISQDE